MTSMTSAAPRPARRAPIYRVAALLLAASTLGTTACGGDSATGPGAGPAGQYALKSIDGASLPMKVYHGPGFDPANNRFYNQLIIVVDRGEVTLLDNGNWAMSFDLTVTGDGATRATSVYADGSYEVDGDEIALELNGGNPGPLPGTLRRGAIDIDRLALTSHYAGNRYTFTK